MTSKRRTEITIETHTITIIRMRNAKSGYCEICEMEVQIFSPPEIISGFCLKGAEIKQMFQTNKIHFVESTEMLCGNSIAEYFMDK